MHDDAAVWKSYGAKMKAVLKAYREGVNQYVKMVDNYLIWADEPGKALTWMDAIVGGVPVTSSGEAIRWRSMLCGIMLSVIHWNWPVKPEIPGLSKNGRRCLNW